MVVAESSTLLVGLLLMLFIVAMVRIEKIAEFANLVLEMKCFYLGIVELRIFASVSRGTKPDREHVPLSLSRSPFMLTTEEPEVLIVALEMISSGIAGFPCTPGPLPLRSGQQDTRGSRA